MNDILAAVDETDATDLFHDAELTLGTKTASGSSSLGPFTVSYGATASFSGGSVTLSPPNVVHVNNCMLAYSLNFSFGIDLNTILPQICLPQICIPIPFDGEVCTPQICLTWPTISVPVSYSDSLTLSADFDINVHLTGGNWVVDIVVAGVPSLDLGPAATAILVAIGAAVTAALLVVPLIGPFLAAAAAAIVAVIGIASLTGWLGALLTPFVSGLTFTVYKQPQLFQVLPASGLLNPAVDININALAADVEATDKNELVLTADI